MKIIKDNIKILCRTRKFIDSNISDSFTKEKYYSISKAVRQFIIQNKIKSLPIDLMKVIHKNRWKSVKYSKSMDIITLIDPNLCVDNWGFTIEMQGKFIIFYDDLISEGSQNFTLAHEIGHIVLKHYLQEVPASMEKEANMFAARLLMPMCVLHECKVETPEDIQNLCSVSNTAARYRFERLQIVKQRNKFYIDKTELKVKEQFDRFIKKNSKV